MADKNILSRLIERAMSRSSQEDYLSTASKQEAAGFGGGFPRTKKSDWKPELSTSELSESFGTGRFKRRNTPEAFGGDPGGTNTQQAAKEAWEKLLDRDGDGKIHPYEAASTLSDKRNNTLIQNAIKRLPKDVREQLDKARDEIMEQIFLSPQENEKPRTPQGIPQRLLDPRTIA